MKYELNPKADISKAIVFTLGLMLSAAVLSPLTMSMLNLVLGNIKV
jgi:hypothetical protein